MPRFGEEHSGYRLADSDTPNHDLYREHRKQGQTESEPRTCPGEPEGEQITIQDRHKGDTHCSPAQAPLSALRRLPPIITAMIAVQLDVGTRARRRRTQLTAP